MSAYCFAGKMLRINLSDHTVDIKKTVDFEDGFWGGRGLNQSLLLNFQAEGVSPFDPENFIIFGSGRLVGTGAPCATRLSIDSKNVFTGGIGSSNVGGKFASELKAAGFDHVIISGKSCEPVYIWIDNSGAEIHDAKSLWGKTIFQTDKILKASIKDKEIQFVAIGPAGENLVWTSAIIESNSRAAARCGLGAIMGSKKLKAIVVRGAHENAIQTADPEQFFRWVEKVTNRLSALPSVKRRRHFGSIAAFPVLNESAGIPVRNFVDEYLSTDELTHYLPNQYDRMCVGTIKSCDPCFMDCQHKYEGSGSNEFPYDKLEANTLLDFGPRLGLIFPEDILACHALCTQYGLDIDNTASVICWTMDCFEKGLLRTTDTDGLVLRWGDPQVVFQLIKKIALREGVGELLSEGSYRASQKIGGEAGKLSIHIKGQDLIEPIRVCKGWALGIAVSPRGGTHTRGAPQTEFRGVDRNIGETIWGVENAGIPREYEGKAKLVTYYERLHAALDSLGLCHFVSNWSSPELLSPKEFAELCSAALGEEVSEEAFMKKGERILTLEKIYNLIHTHFERRDDYPPDIFFEEPIKSGPFKGEKLDRDKWDKMLTEYYSLHDWDPKTSFPKKDRLKMLGLGGYINALEKIGKIV